MDRNDLRWRPDSGLVVVGRETLEASRGSLSYILELLEMAERGLRVSRLEMADRTAQVRKEVEGVVWRISEILLELQLDRLLEVDGWEHPTQVLERPRPSLEDLLEICEERLLREPSGNPRLLHVREKLERAQKIAARARERRLRRMG